METSDLDALGWTPALSTSFAPHAVEGLAPARVAARHRGRFLLYTAQGEVSAEPSGRLRQQADRAAFPAVGDWVAVRTTGGGASIEAVLPRRSAFERASADPTRPNARAEIEVVAANVDLALIVTGALDDLNVRRLERYLAAGWDSGAQPAVVLTKIDLVEDPAALIVLVQAIAPAAQVLGVSNLTGEGVEAVRALIAPGVTAALLGSSGVGKSSLVNRLLGYDRQAISQVRADGRGRHTTTVRELLLLPGGGMVLDTPGMRLFTPADAAGLEATFADVEILARGCRFGDCQHREEPGCAVRAAVEQGLLEPDRLAGWDKLSRELAHVALKDDALAQSLRRKRWKIIHKAQRGNDKRRWSGVE